MFKIISCYPDLIISCYPYPDLLSHSVGSEGVADGEVEGEGFAEGFHVVVAGAAGVVGSVDADAEVAAHHEHADVEAQAGAGAEGDVAQESGGL